MQERLEVAVGGRQPGRLLDLEHELAAGRPVGARGDDDAAGARRPAAAAIRSAPVSSRAPVGEEVGHRGGIDRPPGQVRRDGGGGQDRAEVADGVAPALVELAGLDDDVGRAPRPATGG